MSKEDWDNCNHSWRYRPKRDMWFCKICMKGYKSLPNECCIDLEHKITFTYLKDVIEKAWKYDGCDK